MKLQSVDKNITIGSSNVDLGEALTTHAEQSILRVASKYFGRLNTAAVHFSREGIMYRCTVNMQMGALKMMTGEYSDKEIYKSFNCALEKVAKQLRRAKRELREDKGQRFDKDITLAGDTPLERRANGHANGHAHPEQVDVDAARHYVSDSYDKVVTDLRERHNQVDI